MNIKIMSKIPEEKHHLLARTIFGDMLRGEQREVLYTCNVKGRTKIYDAFSWRFMEEDRLVLEATAIIKLLGQISIEVLIEQYLIYHTLYELEYVLNKHGININTEVTLDSKVGMQGGGEDLEAI